jgi:hypothetical protein
MEGRSFYTGETRFITLTFTTIKRKGKKIIEKNSLGNITEEDK